MSALAYTITVDQDATVRVNGATVAPGADADTTLRSIAEQINQGLASGAIAGELTVALRDERVRGAGHKVQTADRRHLLDVDLFAQMPLLAQAALEPRPAWTLPGPVRLSRSATHITRSLVDEPAPLDDSEMDAREAGRRRRNRRITWAVVGAILAIAALRVGFSVQWGPNTYAAVCEDARTGLRVDASACGDSYHLWRYFAPGDDAPEVGQSAMTGLRELPGGADANKAFPASGGTVSGEGLVEVKR